MISILNYGLGNIKAFENIYNSNSINNKVVSSRRELENCEKLIIPGVGAFDKAMEILENKEFIDPLNYLALEKKIPILGICVGMQIMAEKSEEGRNEGFGWIKSKVKKFDNKIDYLPVPHMGWNNILNSKTNPLTEGINKKYFYFLHSYYFQCEDENNSISSTNYSKSFTSVVFKENIYGVQFHPEKSHDQGTKLLINFSKL